jgi:hypothetical protein
MALEDRGKDRRTSILGGGTKSRRRQAMISEVRPSALSWPTAPSEKPASSTR